MLAKLVNLLRGALRLGQSEPEPDPEPNYGQSVTYTACRACNEGTLEYDAETDADVCSTCGARFPRTE
ncbi:hypothetical protein [Halosegnis sp.]|uniref:hypothetical protein n=1 Tax=Halosegnis sp. TaxID=2864959 RepID=UPI0035D517A2